MKKNNNKKEILKFLTFGIFIIVGVYLFLIFQAIFWVFLIGLLLGMILTKLIEIDKRNKKRNLKNSILGISIIILLIGVFLFLNFKTLFLVFLISLIFGSILSKLVENDKKNKKEKEENEKNK